MAYTDRDDLERLVEREAAERKCDACGLPVDDPARWRHVSCSPPPLPEAYRLFREELKRKVGAS